MGTALPRNCERNLTIPLLGLEVGYDFIEPYDIHSTPATGEL